MLARLAGDEFLVISAGLPNVEVALALAERMLEGIRQEIAVRDSTGDVHQVEIEVHYQPIVELSGATTTGFEALARWRHPQRGVLGPDAFILSTRQLMDPALVGLVANALAASRSTTSGPATRRSST